MIKSISFNSFSLQDASWRTKDIIYRNLPNKVLDMEPLSRRDGFRLVSSFYSDKEISVSGTVTSDTEANLRVLVDNMKRALNTDGWNLDIDDGGATVRWVASVSKINIPEQHYHITQLPFAISFICQPFGKSTTSVSSTNSIVNTSSKTDSIVIVGSATPRPVVRWTVAGTPTTTITALSLTNNTTTDVIAMTGLVLSDNGDYLEIDTDDMSVVQNTGSGEVEIDFTGIFPRFNTSTNSYTTQIVGGGATKTLTQEITYYPSYL